MSGILVSQGFVEFSTIVILLLTLGLAVKMSNKYFRTRQQPLLLWSTGIWIFAISVAIEVLFAFSVYSQVLAKLYLLLVALIVEFLAFGSVSMLKSKKISLAYYSYSLLTTIILAYALIIGSLGNILVNYIVYGILPLSVVIASSIITFPAAIIIIVLALKTYFKQKKPKMISIVLGVIVVSIAGTLYVVQVPAFLYYSEFIGILLLWYGFI